MCLFSIVYQTIPGCPVLVLANRDEALNRPSADPAVRGNRGPEGQWLGGLDFEAGGTWLGVNRAGVLVAVTNRPKTQKPDRPKSRGLLCREVLEQGTLEAGEAEFYRQWKSERFAGFNLIMISAEEGRVFSAGDEFAVQSLTPGIHAVTNRDWNDPSDKRIARVRSLLEAFRGENLPLEEWIRRSQSICGLGDEVGGDALCLPPAKGWGTVSSSIIALMDDIKSSRYLHAAGGSDAAPFHDHSADLVSLLEERIHRIRLRGPWRYEWLSAQEDHPPTGKAALPAEWRSLFGNTGGRVRFQRTFHAPTSLETATQVSLVFEGLGGADRLLLNGSDLTSFILPDTFPRRFLRIGIGELLRPTNDLQIEVVFDPKKSSEPGGLWGTVALEILEREAGG